MCFFYSFYFSHAYILVKLAVIVNLTRVTSQWSTAWATWRYEYTFKRFCSKSMNWGGKIHPKCGHHFLGQTLTCTRKKVSSALTSMYAFPLSPLGYGCDVATSSSYHLTSPHSKLSAKSNHFSPSPIFILLEYFIPAIEMKQATTEPLVLTFPPYYLQWNLNTCELKKVEVLSWEAWSHFEFLMAYKEITCSKHFPKH